MNHFTLGCGFTRRTDTRGGQDDDLSLNFSFKLKTDDLSSKKVDAVEFVGDDDG